MENEKNSTSIISQRLTELMEEKHVSKADLARIADVSRSSVNGWFKRGSLSKDSAAKVSATLGVSLAWLLGEAEDTENNKLTQEEKYLLAAFRELGPSERRNMLGAFEMRVQELKEYKKKLDI